MKKRWNLIFVCLLLVIGITGCGNKGKEEQKEPGTTGESQTEEENLVEMDSIKLTIWSPAEDQNQEMGGWLTSMCDRFNDEHSEWNIEFTYGVCAEGEAASLLSQDVEAGADLYLYANDNLPALLSVGAVSRLGGQTLSYVEENMDEDMVASVTYNEAVYGIPYTSNTWFMYYNKNILSEEDVESLESMLKKTKVAFPLTNSWYLPSFYLANGCTLYGDGTEENKGVDFGGRKGAQVTEYLVDLVKNPHFVNDESGAGIAGMTMGSIGAMFSGSWDYQNVCDAIGEENVGIAPLPTITIGGEEKQLLAFAGSKAIGINPNCEYPEVAVALALYLGSNEAQKVHYDLRGIVPTNEDVAELEEVANNPIVKGQMDALEESSVIQPLVSGMSLFWTPMENMGRAILSGEVNKENSKALTEQMNDAMNREVVE